MFCNKKSSKIFLFTTLFGSVFLLTPNFIFAATDHIVISQVQVSGVSATDEFVELYNPTASTIDLTGWRLAKKVSSGTQTNLITSMSGSIPSHKYMLITPQTGYAGSVPSDATYSSSSASVTSNNTVLIYSDSGFTVVDKVGMGTATDFETATTISPDASQSVQRKIDDANGNGLDTNNNLDDFAVLALSSPHNLNFIVPTPSATPTPTATPSATPAQTQSPTPTQTASPSPSSSPTQVPTPTPSATPTTTPIVTVTPVATVAPSPKSSSHPIYWPKKFIFPKFEVWKIFNRFQESKFDRECKRN